MIQRRQKPYQGVRLVFYKNANFTTLNKINKEAIDLFIQYKVTKSGKLNFTKKSKIPVRFLFETDKVLSSFPTISEVGTKNGIKIEPKYSFSIFYKKGETPKYCDRKEKFNSTYKPSSNNDLSLFYIKNLTKEDLSKSNLSRIQNHLTLYFELDKDLQPTNITTNSRSRTLENKVIELFKKYPFRKYHNFSLFYK